MTKVAILGSTGMLGHSLANSLERDFEVTRIGRGEITKIDALLDDFESIKGFDFVINCIGIIWQAQNPSRLETFKVNSRFPWKLADHCKKTNTRLIHASTDCVFSGKRGLYTELDPTDSDDDYGLSKSLGEPTGCMVLRTSILGREMKTRRSLLEWVISNKSGRVKGFTNHMWNGITTDEYGRVARQIMENDLYSEGTFHVFSEITSKFELIKSISKSLDLGIEVEETSADHSIDRSLSTVKQLRENLQISGLEDMIRRLRENP